ncbi:MAG: radical SAM protein [Candidatus Zixiibacteriota bacterium]
MKIEDYLEIEDEKKARLRQTASFLPAVNIPASLQRMGTSPFEQALIKEIVPIMETTLEGAVPSPAYARVCLSLSCEHNCPGCNCGGKPRNTRSLMNPANFARLLESLHFLQIRYIDFSGGGEPTLHPDLERLAGMCLRDSFRLGLATNAAGLNEPMIRLLVDGFSFLRVNLDASNDAVYRRIHHPTNPTEFRRVLDNLDRIVSERAKRKSNLVVGAKVRLCQSNLNFLEEIVALVKDMGLDYVQFSVNRFASDHVLSEQMKGSEKLIKDLKRGYHPFPVYSKTECGEQERGCRLSSVQLVIEPSGEVYSCPHAAQHPEALSFGNIFRSSAERLWLGAKHRQVVRHLQQNDCPLKDCRWHFLSEVAMTSLG